MRKLVREGGIAVLVTTMMLSLSACGGESGPQGTYAVGVNPAAEAIAVGADDSPESRVVAALYEQLLTGAGRQAKPAAGSYRTAADTAKAVVAGSVDLAPAYETNLLRTFAPGQRHAGNMAAALSTALPVGIEALPGAAAQNGVLLAVSQETAARYHLRSLADLAAVTDRLTLGGPAATDADAPPVDVLAKVYHATLDPAGTSATADVLVLRSTDPLIAREKLVVLADPQGVVPAEHVVPLVNSVHLDKATVTALARLNAALTTSQLASLTAEVLAGQSPDRTAAGWLRATGITH
jgi:osmoprotectant transport system substrate-binding protein